jgi:hypothetical protein
MIWERQPNLPAEDLTALSLNGEDGFLATSRSGLLLRGQRFGTTQTLARATAPLLAVACQEGAVAAVGQRGVFLLQQDGEAREEVIDPELTLTGVAPFGVRQWVVSAKLGVRTGAILIGEPGQWEFLGPGLRLEPLYAVAAASEGCVLAGERGFLARFTPSGLTRLETKTHHPLRTVALAGDVVFAAGGGWAQRMPILLRHDGREASAILHANGSRVITGIALRGSELWASEVRSDGDAWSGVAYATGASARSREHLFADRKLAGIACNDASLVIWGNHGFIAWGARF